MSLLPGFPGPQSQKSFFYCIEFSYEFIKEKSRKNYIMRLIQNLTISWEINFYVKKNLKKMFWAIKTLLDPSIGP